MTQSLPTEPPTDPVETEEEMIERAIAHMAASQDFLTERAKAMLKRFCPEGAGDTQ